MVFWQDAQGMIQVVDNTLPVYTWCLLFSNYAWVDSLRWPSNCSGPCSSWRLLILFCDLSKIGRNFELLHFKCSIVTWMHKFKNGLISFFKLSRIIPYIFSMHAVRCCLNSRAGYLASILDLDVSFPSIPLYPLEIPVPIVDERKPWNIMVSFINLLGFVAITVKNFVEELTCAILPNKVVGEVRLRFEVALGALLALIVFCRRNRRVEVVESQYDRSVMLFWLWNSIVLQISFLV